jgi:hypothetical protein
VTLATLLPATLLSQTSGPAVSRRDTVVFLTGIAVLGVAVSWGGTWLWNTASARLPVTTAGILINIETVSGYVYVYAARQHWPPLGQILGFALILAGVGLALTRRQAPTHPTPALRSDHGSARSRREWQARRYRIGLHWCERPPRFADTVAVPGSVADPDCHHVPAVEPVAGNGGLVNDNSVEQWLR